MRLIDELRGYARVNLGRNERSTPEAQLADRAADALDLAVMALEFYADQSGAGDGYAIRDRSMGDQREDGHVFCDGGDLARATLSRLRGKA